MWIKDTPSHFRKSIFFGELESCSDEAKNWSASSSKESVPKMSSRAPALITFDFSRKLIDLLEAELSGLDLSRNFCGTLRGNFLEDLLSDDPKPRVPLPGIGARFHDYTGGFVFYQRMMRFVLSLGHIDQKTGWNMTLGVDSSLLIDIFDVGVNRMPEFEEAVLIAKEFRFGHQEILDDSLVHPLGVKPHDHSPILNLFGN